MMGTRGQTSQTRSILKALRAPGEGELGEALLGAQGQGLPLPGNVSHSTGALFSSRLGLSAQARGRETGKTKSSAHREMETEIRQQWPVGGGG